jgi:hypothetical protein
MLKQGDTFLLAETPYNVLEIKIETVQHIKHGTMRRYIAGEKISEQEWLKNPYHDYYVTCEPVTPSLMHRKRTIVWMESEFLNQKPI